MVGVSGVAVFENTDKNEVLIYPLDVIKLTDDELQAILRGDAELKLVPYVTADNYKVTRFKKKA